MDHGTNNSLLVHSRRYFSRLSHPYSSSSRRIAWPRSSDHFGSVCLWTCVQRTGKNTGCSQVSFSSCSAAGSDCLLAFKEMLPILQFQFQVTQRVTLFAVIITIMHNSWYHAKRTSYDCSDIIFWLYHLTMIMNHDIVYVISHHCMRYHDSSCGITGIDPNYTIMMGYLIIIRAEVRSSFITTTTVREESQVTPQGRYLWHDSFIIFQTIIIVLTHFKWNSSLVIQSIWYCTSRSLKQRPGNLIHWQDNKHSPRFYTN